MSFDWQTFENTIAQLMASAAGLPVGKVMWEGQNAARPALPYVSLFRDAEECLSFTTERSAGDNPSGHPGVPAGTDTITPAIDPATPAASVAVGHLSQWGEAGTTGTCTIEPSAPAKTEVCTFTVGASGIVLSPWPSKAHAAGAAVSRAVVIGTELLQKHAVPAEFTLRIQTYTATVRGNASASALLGQIHSAFDFESVKALLLDVGAVVVDKLTIQNLTGLIETKIEGRASLDVRIRFTDRAEESATWIESAEVTPTVDAVEGDPFDVP